MENHKGDNLDLKGAVTKREIIKLRRAILNPVTILGKISILG